MYNIAICSSEMDINWITDKLYSIGSRYDEISIITFYSEIELFETDILCYDLILVEVGKLHYNEVTLVKKLREIKKDILIALFSDRTPPVCEHFGIGVYRYIMQNSNDIEIQNEVQDLFMEMQDFRDNLYLEIVNDGRVYKVKINDVIYISRDGRGSLVVTRWKYKNFNYIEIHSNEDLNSWYKQLANKGFRFAHRSYIVNMRNIVSVEKNEILMENGACLTISRTYRKEFHNEFSQCLNKKYRRNNRE